MNLVEKLLVLCFWCGFFTVEVRTIPRTLLYDFNVAEASYLPKGDDMSSGPIRLREPLLFFGLPFDTIFVNSNGFLSFQTDIPQFINTEFPLDYPIIAPFYSNVDTTGAGRISYYQTENPHLLERATENIHENFLNNGDFQATSLLIVTWEGVGYHKRGSDRINTFQVVIATDGIETYVEFLYPEKSLNWIQGTGDESGLPDARAQAGIISPEGVLVTLPGSGTEQVRNLEKWSNMGLEGQFLFRVDELEVIEPDTGEDSNKPPIGIPQSCAEASTFCHVNSKCTQYPAGICCQCNPNFYGNGKYCVKKDSPLRVNGKVFGTINGEKLEHLDLQSYVVMSDGRAYTAISRIPKSIGSNIQSLQILGGIIGYLFAKPVRDAVNGYQLTGGVFNHTATITFLNTSQVVNIRQKYLGLDVFDQLRLEANINGELPKLPEDSKVTIDEYQEVYTISKPGLIQMTSQRTLKFTLPNGDEVTHLYKVDQAFIFDYCEFDTSTSDQTWKLKVGKNFISYEGREQIIRFGLSNIILPLEDFDPCLAGRSQCTEYSSCVVDNESFRCICNPGFQEFYNGTQILCNDINECQSGQNDCDYNAQCVNGLGSYFCQCNPGYEGNGFLCDNSKSCENITCFENAECVENNGIAECKCIQGYSGNGKYCTPIPDYSCHTGNNCSPYGYCAIDPSSQKYYCACLPEYTGDGYTCTPLEVVPTTTTASGVQFTTDNIRPTQKTVETCLLGVCWCPDGYELLPGTKYCILTEDTTHPIEISSTTETIETCELRNNCHSNATCQYSDALHSYACICNEGFEGDGLTCTVEVVSCAKVDNCDPHATCTYDEKLGRSRCICNSGYYGDGYTCAIAGICTSHQDCSPTEECVYTSSQRYECICKEGFERDSQNQCIQSTGTCGGGRCVENAECLYDEEYQTFYCTCKIGFVGDGITECKEKIVGCDTLNNCGTHATCTYIEEAVSYKCVCNEGFFGDGFTCYTERNCHIEPSMCDPHATCITDSNRRFKCQCNTGYMGNGTACREIFRHEEEFLLVNQGMATLRIPLDHSKSNIKRPIQIKPYQTAVGLDTDCLEGRVYWSDVSNRAIRSSLFNGSNKIDFIQQGIGSPEGLAVDWVSRNIYWTDSTLDTIEVANIDTKLRRTLFKTNLVNPRGIAVHPQRGKIFWTDWDRKNPKIEWANADGSGRSIFLQGPEVSLPNSLAIDYDTEQLCYADAGTKSIECVHIDSKSSQKIALNCTYPFGIAITKREIYWSDWISKQIERVDKYTLNRLKPLPVPLGGSGNKLFSLVAVAGNCPSLTNVCEYVRNQCPAEHICLPNGLGSRQCLCGYNADKPDVPPNCML